MIEHIMNPIRKLKSIDIPQTILNMRIENKFGKSENLSHEMERIPKPRLLTFLGRKRFDRFQIEIEIQMQVRQPLSMNQEDSAY